MVLLYCKKGGISIKALEETLFNLLIQEDYSSLERGKLKFGIQIVLSEFLKLIIIYFIASLLGCIIPTLIIHLTFFFLRQVCLGYHFNNLYVCVSLSVITFPIVAFFLIDIKLEFLDVHLYLGFGIMLLVIYLIAPKGTINQPIINIHHREYLQKKITLRILIIATIFCFSSWEVKIFIAYGVFLEKIMLVIQLLKERFKNEKREKISEL